jgi:hypothetical protein
MELYDLVPEWQERLELRRLRGNGAIPPHGSLRDIGYVPRIDVELYIRGIFGGGKRPLSPVASGADDQESPEMASDVLEDELAAILTENMAGGPSAAAASSSTPAFDAVASPTEDFDPVEAKQKYEAHMACAKGRGEVRCSFIAHSGVLRKFSVLCIGYSCPHFSGAT